MCLPPSNPAGKVVNVAFPVTEPKSRTDEPEVPASEDVSKPGFRAQHSSVERLWRAPSTVTFRVDPRDASRARVVVVNNTWARVDRRILDWK